MPKHALYAYQAAVVAGLRTAVGWRSQQDATRRGERLRYSHAAFGSGGNYRTHQRACGTQLRGGRVSLPTEAYYRDHLFLVQEISFFEI